MYTLHGISVDKLEETEISTIFLVDDHSEVEFSFVDEDGYRGVTLEGHDGYMNVKDEGLDMEKFAAVLYMTAKDLGTDEVEDITGLDLVYMGKILN